jgi:hypothetical protein
MLLVHLLLAMQAQVQMQLQGCSSVHLCLVPWKALCMRSLQQCGRSCLQGPCLSDSAQQHSPKWLISQQIRPPLRINSGMRKPARPMWWTCSMRQASHQASDSALQQATK